MRSPRRENTPPAPERRIDRRELLRSAARGAAAAALAVVGLVLARRHSGLSGQDCVNQSICRGCPVVGGCGLPQALSFRRVTGEGDHGG